MARGARVWLTIVGLGTLLAAGVGAPRASGQAAAPAKLIHHKHRSFRVPITIDPAHRSQIREVQLYASADGGQTWEQAGTTTPDQPLFTFKAPRDGEYWFAARTVDAQGRPAPADERAIEPKMKVVVDTVKPTIELAPRPRRGSQASVRWEVRDERLALGSMTLEYQAEGARDWAQVPIRSPALIGAETWDAGTTGRVRVRATIKDLAGNLGEAEMSLPSGNATDPGPVTDAGPDDSAPPPIVPIASRTATATNPEDDGFDAPLIDEAPPARTAPSSSGAATLLVPSARFPLQYEVEDAGPNGPALVELWVTQDGGRTWHRQAEDDDRRSPYTVDLGGGGTYGLWLVVQGPGGVGDPPPAPGDRPQTWVEVDNRPPLVEIDPPRVGQGASAGKVQITWRASDPHLADRPIVLSYRPDTPDAAWQPITKRIDNTGRFVWNVPPAIPPRFHLKVEAVDSLGHVGSAETTDSGPVVIDRARPKGRIIGLDPSARLGADGRSRR